MALQVNYKNRIGYFTLPQGDKKFRIHICHANCLCAMMNFYKDENGEKMAQLYAFFADVPHVKQCFKNGLFIRNWDNFVFKAKECDSEMWKFIRLLADNGKKVTIK